MAKREKELGKEAASVAKQAAEATKKRAELDRLEAEVGLPFCCVRECCCTSRWHFLLGAVAPRRNPTPCLALLLSCPGKRSPLFALARSLLLPAPGAGLCCVQAA